MDKAKSQNIIENQVIKSSKKFQSQVHVMTSRTDIYSVRNLIFCERGAIVWDLTSPKYYKTVIEYWLSRKRNE